jgi:predicted PurR-regulated permease PerM
MTRRQTTLYWASAAIAFLLFLWIFGGMLGPFLFGAAIAYLTDPVADRLEKLGLSRVVATLIITVCAFVILVIAVLSLSPIIIDQAQELIQQAPRYLDKLLRMVYELSPGLVPDYWTPANEAAREAGQATRPNGEQNGGPSLAEPAARWGLNALKGLVSGGIAFIKLLGVVVITPIVAFYLLMDWDRAVAAIDDLLPRQYVDTIRKLARDIDATLSAFLRGQLLVCLILGSFYAVALTLAGLPFGALVGIFAGIISFVPFVGSMVGLLLSVGIALSTFWGDWWHIALIAGIFLGGQAVEGNVLTPMMVGDRVGLHPVWLIFSLSAFGFVFGLPGVLVAVPMAASLGVIARWGTERYQESQLYRGRPNRE